MTLLFNITIMALGFLTSLQTLELKPMLASGIAVFSFCLLDRIANNIKELNKP